MSTAIANGGSPAADDGLLRDTFHVVPPPPPRQRPWSEVAIAVGLAVLINLVVILSLIFKPPVSMPPGEPPSISVDLVPEPKPEPQPEPQPEPEPQPQPEQEKPEIMPFSRSGDDPVTDAGRGEEPDDNSLRTDSEKDTPDPDEVTTKEQERKAEEDIPGWAQTIMPGFDMRAGNPVASSPERQAERSSGGANAYFNEVKSHILANISSVETAGLSGSAQFEIVVHRSGKLVSLKVVKSSGYPSLDKAFANGIIRAQPYRYPKGIRSDFVPMMVELHSRPEGQ